MPENPGVRVDAPTEEEIAPAGNPSALQRTVAYKIKLED